jgi:hypothetical protein
MPYEYRNLSPKQRKEVVAQRKALGYPLHAPPHPFRDKGYYLLTAANYDHARVMEAPERRTEFETRLLNYIHYNPVKHGYVENAFDWQWSSLGLYYEEHGRDWLREKWETYLPEKGFGKGWDEMG